MRKRRTSLLCHLGGVYYRASFAAEFAVTVVMRLRAWPRRVRGRVLLDDRALNALAGEFIDLGPPPAPRRLVGSPTVAQRQTAAIAKALS
jgi:ABC-type sugar transport system ATPase subunit